MPKRGSHWYRIRVDLQTHTSVKAPVHRIHAIAWRGRHGEVQRKWASLEISDRRSSRGGPGRVDVDAHDTAQGDTDLLLQAFDAARKADAGVDGFLAGLIDGELTYGVLAW